MRTHLLRGILALVAVSIGCTHAPPPPPSAAAVAIATNVLAPETRAPDEKHCVSGMVYRPLLTVDSVRIGQFSATNRTWPVRAFISGRCDGFNVFGHFNETRDFSVSEDGFGGWKEYKRG